MTTSYRPTLPAAVAVAEPSRPRLLVLATSLVSIGFVAGYGALMAMYLAERAAVISTGETWLPAGTVIPLTQPNFMALTMVWSLVSMAWAIAAINSDDRSNAKVALSLTLLFGLGVLAQTGYLLFLMEVEIAATRAGLLLLAVIGSHLAILAGAMGFVLVTLMRLFVGEYSSRDNDGIWAATVFWYVMVGLYLVLWYAVYITK